MIDRLIYSHSEREIRRQEIVECARRGTFTLEDLASRFNVTPKYVGVICIKAGVKCKRKERKGICHYDWSKADWSKPDGEISRVLGCSRQAVDQMRANKGIPKVKAERQKSRELVIEMIKAGHSRKEIYQVAKVGEYVVWARSKEIGIPVKKGPYYNTLKVDWSKGKLAIDE